jgi:hypothetical protein
MKSGSYTRNKYLKQQSEWCKTFLNQFFFLAREVLELAAWYRSKSITNRLGILENGPTQKNAYWASSPP